MSVCLLAVAAVLAAADPPEPAVRKLLEEQRAAWNQGDLEGYMAGYWRSPALTFLSGTSVTRGWEQTLARYRKRYQQGGTEMGKLDFSELAVEPIAPDAAFARGRWHLAFADGKGAGGVFTLLLRRLPEGFRIVHDHSSGEADAVAAPSLPAGVVLELRGEIPRPGGLTRNEMEQAGAVDVRWSDHGREHLIHGVPLDKLLAARGLAPGRMGKGVPPAEKRSGWKMAVLATAADGFQAAFSLAELSEAMGPTRALVVWEMDGRPVPPELGPRRLVVTTDREGSRSLRNLERIEIVDVRKAAVR